MRLSTFFFCLISSVVVLFLTACSDKENGQEKIQETEKTTKDVPNFSEINNTNEKKAAFFEHFYPLVVEANKAVLDERKIIKTAALQSDAVRKLCEKYTKFDCAVMDQEKKQQLLKRVGVIAPSLVLAQAANESAWGTSRFAVEGNNYFGQWCFSEGCGLVPEKRVAGAAHEVRKFDNAEQSVQAYILNLNTNAAYKTLRSIRAEKRQAQGRFTGIDLSAGLLSYSERGQAYVDELQSMIRYNNLEQYDEQFWQEVN